MRGEPEGAPDPELTGKQEECGEASVRHVGLVELLREPQS